MVGRTYLEHGKPVEVLVQWSGAVPAGFGLDRPMDPENGFVVGGSAERWAYLIRSNKRVKGGPRNVLIRRANGDLVVRPFRGLRKVADSQGTDA